MSKMRGVQVSRPNGPFEIVERDIPEPGPGRVRIKVQACGICHSDTVTKEGTFPGLQYPRVPGHEVGIARGKDKEPLAKKLGAQVYIDSQSQDPAAELLKLGGAKVILATVTSAEAMSAVLGGLGIHGTFMVIGAAGPMEVSPLFLILGQRSVKGWYSGTSIDSQDTLDFSVQAGVRAMNEVYSLERVEEAYERMLSGKARFRVVLTMGN
jgi:D-arabinose 1-dehydrogenase-like Zn-dependent alcohol dehydrogenase